MLTPEQREIVKKARKRIAYRSRWCQNQQALTRGKSPCTFDYPEARSFCAVGALAVEYLSLVKKRNEASAKALVLAGVLPLQQSLIQINDGLDGHAKVLAIFDKALAE